MGAGYPEFIECEVEGLPLSPDARVVCRVAMMSFGRGMVNLLSKWWLLMGRAQGFSSSARFTPLSFQGFRSALKLRVDSIEMSDDLETLAEPLKKLPAAECELFFLRSRNEEMDVMLPGFLSRSRMLLRSRAMSALKAFLMGESLAAEAGACWSSFESKY